MDFTVTGFEELYCECGSSVLYPPIPCGTRRPECSRPCSRPHSCEHPALHNCHSQPVCPPCTVLTQKYCYGKHEVSMPSAIWILICRWECKFEHFGVNSNSVFAVAHIYNNILVSEKLSWPVSESGVCGCVCMPACLRKRGPVSECLFESPPVEGKWPAVVRPLWLKKRPHF